MSELLLHGRPSFSCYTRLPVIASRGSWPRLFAAALCLGAFVPCAAHADEAPAEPPKPPPAPTQPLAAQPATAPPPPKPEDVSPAGRFEFGSYGRVHLASDLRGGTGRKANVVAHGTRIDEDDYVELELRREDTFRSVVKSRVVATLALFGPFFHFTGKVPDQLAIRNLYAQGTYKGVSIWAGSRMYRGDDIYLLNWWPLDNQNTIGGGAFGTLTDSGERDGPPRYETVLAAHVGQQRLDNPFQYQKTPVVAPNNGFGAVDVVKLDRPRMVETLKLTQHIRDGRAGFKLALYGEAHELAAGVYRDPLTNQDRGLPADQGFLVGSQLTYYTGERDTYATLWLRHARGIAAYDPLAVPQTFANDRTTSGTTETTVAFAANFERESFGVLGAGYLRFFRDGSGSVLSPQKYDEGTAVVRPQLYLHDHFGLAVEGSYQARRLGVLDKAADAPLTAGVIRGAVIPYFSFAGRGSFKRPQIYAIYAATARDAGARALYAPEDVYSTRKLEHYAGIGVEWWFNSSSYP
jgi:maltoporin